MRRANRTDNNHAEIRDGLRQVLGFWAVLDMSHVGGGFPDLVVHFREKTYFLEIKSTRRDDLTDAEIEFMEKWPGHYAVVMSLEEAFEEIGLR